MLPPEDHPLPKEKRRSRRYPTDIDAVMFFDRISFDVSIKDVSDLGCCFEGAAAVRKGDEVVFRFGAQTVVATVAWSAPPLSGANFHREIDALRMLRTGGNPSPFLKRRRADAMIPPRKG